MERRRADLSDDAACDALALIAASPFTAGPPDRILPLRALDLAWLLSPSGP